MINHTDNNAPKQYVSLCYLIGLSTCYSLGIFYTGYASIYFNTVNFQVIRHEFNIPWESGTALGIMSGIVYLGALVGSLFTELVLKYLSRRHCFYFFNALVFIGGILIIIPNAITLLIGRFLQGIAMAGFMSIVAIYLKQMAPISLIGALIAYQTTFSMLGYTCAFGFALFLCEFMKIKQSWPYIFSFPLLVMGVQIILIRFVFTYETPKYLLLNGRTEEAREVIAKIYHENYFEQNYHRILKDLEADHIQLSDVEKEYPKDHPRAIFLGFFMFVSQAFGGQTLIVTFSPIIVGTFLPKLTKFLPFLINLQGLLFSFFMIIVASHFGRKQILAGGSFFLGICLIVLCIGLLYNEDGHYWGRILAVITIQLYPIIYQNGKGLGFYLYPSEILQPLWFPYLLCLYWGTQWIVITIFPVYQESAQQYCPLIYAFFGIIQIISAIIFKIMMVETKDRTELQIRQQFNESKGICPNS